MTPEKFIARYKGHQVRINNNYRGQDLLPGIINRTGIVMEQDREYIRVAFNPPHADLKKGINFEVDELDIINDGPLPLPG